MNIHELVLTQPNMKKFNGRLNVWRIFLGPSLQPLKEFA